MYIDANTPQQLHLLEHTLLANIGKLPKHRALHQSLPSTSTRAIRMQQLHLAPTPPEEAQLHKESPGEHHDLQDIAIPSVHVTLELQSRL